MAQLDALKSLHTALVDAVEGYDEAIKDAGSSDTRPLFEEVRALHAASHGELDAVLTAKGEEPDESGSFMATLHKTIISVRSAVKGLDRSSLKPFISGEQRLVESYDEAIAENQSDAGVTNTLTSQKTRLLAMISKMQSQAA